MSRYCEKCEHKLTAKDDIRYGICELCQINHLRNLCGLKLLARKDISLTKRSGAFWSAGEACPKKRTAKQEGAPLFTTQDLLEHIDELGYFGGFYRSSK